MARWPVTELFVTEMTCGNCARHVTEALQGVTGVQSAIVSLDSHQATIRWRSDFHPDIAAAIEAVRAEGYSAEVLQAHEHHHGEDGLAGWRWNLLLGVPV